MLSEYDKLIETGAISSLKRDVLLEGSDDLYYLSHIEQWFEEEAGQAAAEEAIAIQFVSPRS